jgi:hypothetical protein
MEGNLLIISMSHFYAVFPVVAEFVDAILSRQLCIPFFSTSKFQITTRRMGRYWRHFTLE